jgi:hypothetical protein
LRVLGRDGGIPALSWSRGRSTRRANHPGSDQDLRGYHPQKTYNLLAHKYNSRKLENALQVYHPRATLCLEIATIPGRRNFSYVWSTTGFLRRVERSAWHERVFETTAVPAERSAASKVNATSVPGRTPRIRCRVPLRGELRPFSWPRKHLESKQ